MVLESQLRNHYKINLASMPEEKRHLESLPLSELWCIGLCFELLHAVDRNLTKHDGEGKKNLTWLITESKHHTAKKIYHTLALLTQYNKSKLQNTLIKHKVANMNYDSFHRFKQLLSSFDKKHSAIFLQLIEEAQHHSNRSNEPRINIEKFNALLTFDVNTQHLLPELLQLAQLLKQNNKNFLDQNYSSLLRFTDQRIVQTVHDSITSLCSCIHSLKEENVNSIFYFETKNSVILQNGLIHCLQDYNLLNTNNFTMLIQKPFEKFFLNDISPEKLIMHFRVIIEQADTQKLTQESVEQTILLLKKDVSRNKENSDENLIDLVAHPYITQLQRPLHEKDVQPNRLNEKELPSLPNSPVSPEDTTPLLARNFI